MINIDKLINDKLEVLFQEVQKEAGIISGDIAPEDNETLENLKNDLAGLLYMIVDYQKEASHENF